VLNREERQSTMVTTWGLAVLVAQSILGSGHHSPRPGCCDACGVGKGEVIAGIVRLQTCPNWRARDDAAHDLRKFDWRCHPEIVEALTAALVRDCEEEVREEAAESLVKMGACMPQAHEALARAARCDPDWATRHWARKGLKAFGRRCVDRCDVCGPTPDDVGPIAPVLTPTPIPIPGEVSSSVAAPTPIPGEIPAPPPLESGVAPPVDAPAIPPGPSPFSEPPPPPEPEPVLRPLPPTSSRGRDGRIPWLQRTFGIGRRARSDKDEDVKEVEGRDEGRGSRLTGLLPLKRTARD
jgi:hypothetical protein